MVSGQEATWLTAAVFVIGGIAYGALKYLKKVRKDNSITFSKKRFGKTILVYLAAGLFVIATGGPMTTPELTAAAATVTPLVDSYLNDLIEQFDAN